MATETMVLVVNRNSWSSRTVANHYIHFRQVPDRNVILLDYRGSADRLSIDAFRDQILAPVWEEIDRRKLDKQIDYIIYSADFPYRIDFSRRVPAGTEFPEAAITGLTYFSDQVFGTGTPFAHWDVTTDANPNAYAVAAWRKGESLGIRAFRSDLPRGTQKRSYRLSTMLGYTTGRGNSVGEIVSYLHRAAIADGTHPTGTFYFMENSDIRSQARSSAFTAVVNALEGAGFQAEVVSGQVPPAGSQVIGAVLGSSDFQWNESAQILPGAVCENFTSFGGVLHENAAQTPLSVLLRLGAAGSSGTVVEPRAIPHKFPHPMLHIHYARGCTLAESFYQAVLSPYQLLVVGDPWCRPWGSRPQVEVAGIADDGTYSGEISLVPRVVVPGAQARSVQLYLDGQHLTSVRPDQSYRLDTRAFADGFHQITAVAEADTPIAISGRRHIPVYFNNSHRWVELLPIEGARAVFGSSWRIRVRSRGCQRLALTSQGETLARMDAGEGEFRIKLDDVGIGPVQFQAVGFAEGDVQPVRSQPYETEIAPPPLTAPAARRAAAPAQPGIVLQRGADHRQVITDTRTPNWPEVAGVPANGTFTVRGVVEAPIADLYQFRGTWIGSARLTWNGQLKYAGDAAGLQFGIPLNLKPGRQEFSCEVHLKGSPRAEIQFGNRGAQQLDARNSRTVP